PLRPHARNVHHPRRQRRHQAHPIGPLRTIVGHHHDTSQVARCRHRIGRTRSPQRKIRRRVHRRDDLRRIVLRRRIHFPPRNNRRIREKPHTRRRRHHHNLRRPPPPRRHIPKIAHHHRTRIRARTPCGTRRNKIHPVRQRIRQHHPRRPDRPQIRHRQEISHRRIQHHLVRRSRHRQHQIIHRQNPRRNLRRIVCRHQIQPVPRHLRPIRHNNTRSRLHHNRHHRHRPRIDIGHVAPHHTTRHVRACPPRHRGPDEQRPRRNRIHQPHPRHRRRPQIAQRHRIRQITQQTHRISRLRHPHRQVRKRIRRRNIQPPPPRDEPHVTRQIIHHEERPNPVR